MTVKAPSIILEKVSVEFPVYDVQDRSFRSALLGKSKLKKIDDASSSRTVLKALDSVTINISSGERVALIGKNGAGKSTLLQVMAGIYEPVEGSCVTIGSVASMLNLGFGMREDLSGWENIELAGLMAGMKQSEIELKKDETAEFSELGEYLSLPISTYSSGMRARLAFSITSSIEADILLIDEVFGAGDAAFTEKAAKRMEEMIHSSEIMVFASHSDELLRRFCTRGILLIDGEVKYIGTVERALSSYHQEQ